MNALHNFVLIFPLENRRNIFFKHPMGYGITDIKRFCAGKTHVASSPSGERDYFHTVSSETHYYRFGKYAYFNLFQAHITLFFQ